MKKKILFIIPILVFMFGTIVYALDITNFRIDDGEGNALLEITLYDSKGEPTDLEEDDVFADIDKTEYKDEIINSFMNNSPSSFKIIDASTDILVKGHFTIRVFVGDTFKPNTSVAIYKFDEDKEEVGRESFVVAVDDDGYISFKDTELTTFIITSETNSLLNNPVTDNPITDSHIIDGHDDTWDDYYYDDYEVDEAIIAMVVTVLAIITILGIIFIALLPVVIVVVVLIIILVSNSKKKNK